MSGRSRILALLRFGVIPSLYYYSLHYSGLFSTFPYIYSRSTATIKNGEDLKKVLKSSRDTLNTATLVPGGNLSPQQSLMFTCTKKITNFYTFFQLLRPLSPRDLQPLLAGRADLDPADWRRHTRLKHVTPDAPIVAWFWEIVEEFDAEMRARLLQVL